MSLKIAATCMALLPLSTVMAQNTERGQPNDNQRMMEGFGIQIPSDKQYEKMVRKAYKHPLGSKKNPVRADAAEGQREYLNRLRCADGSSPAYERSGNVGQGVYGYIVDLYEVDCGDGAPGETEIYMDLYHGGYVEQEAVTGFALAGAAPDTEESMPQNPNGSSDIVPELDTGEEDESEAPPEPEAEQPIPV